jgi:hypothetical protein
MEQQTAGRPDWPFALILKAGVLNAVLVTVISGFLIALFSGTGTNDPYTGITPGTGIAMEPLARSIWNAIPNQWEVAKATVLLCPITAVSYGFFGLLAGVAGGALAHLRNRHTAARGFAVAVAVAGFLLACVLLTALNRVHGMLCVFLGTPSAWICVRAFRKRFRAFGYFRSPAGGR